jgi:hypothetical protein
MSDEIAESIVTPDGHPRREALTAIVRTAALFRGIVMELAESHPDIVLPMVEKNEEAVVAGERAIKSWSDYLEIR